MIKAIKYGVILCTTIFLAEILLRVSPYNTFGAGRELEHKRKIFGSPKTNVVDPDFGFRPVLGNSFYNIYGTKVNKYSLNKQPGTIRLLFIGDSVTAKGYIVEGLKKVYGEDKFEYWNAGVGSFNTVQEVNFYKKYNKFIKPDHVILSFNLNDFGTTPVAFFNTKNQLVVFAPKMPIKKVNTVLFKNSMLYRLYLGITVRLNKKIRKEIEYEAIRSITELRDVLSNEHINLTVLIIPIFKPYNKWRESEKRLRYKIIKILEGLGIRYFDLIEVINDAERDGIVMYEEDIWHPSKEMGLYCARYLYKKGLLIN